MEITKDKTKDEMTEEAKEKMKDEEEDERWEELNSEKVIQNYHQLHTHKYLARPSTCWWGTCEEPSRLRHFFVFGFF